MCASQPLFRNSACPKHYLTITAKTWLPLFGARNCQRVKRIAVCGGTVKGPKNARSLVVSDVRPIYEMMTWKRHPKLATGRFSFVYTAQNMPNRHRKEAALMLKQDCQALTNFLCLIPI